jgi:predicted  nucleic acid-binding Zn-ribbon protein
MVSTARVLYRLQLLDSDLSERLSKLREAEGLVGESRELRAARRARDKAATELATWGTRLRELEMDLEALNGRITGTQERLYSGQVTNPKELSALEQDLQHSKLSRDQVEDQVLLAMERVDRCEKAAADAVARLDEVEARWHAQQGQLATEIEQLQAQAAALNQERGSVAAQLGASDLALYEELLRTKGGRAVVLLVDQMCQGCRVTVPSSKGQQVRRGREVVTCTNCGRILTTEQ